MILIFSIFISLILMTFLLVFFSNFLLLNSQFDVILNLIQNQNNILDSLSKDIVITEELHNSSLNLIPVCDAKFTNYLIVGSIALLIIGLGLVTISLNHGSAYCILDKISTTSTLTTQTTYQCTEEGIQTIGELCLQVNSMATFENANLLHAYNESLIETSLAVVETAIDTVT